MGNGQPKLALGVSETAAALGVNRKSVVALLESGRLRGTRLSDGPRSKWLIPIAALHEFLGERVA